MIVLIFLLVMANAAIADFNPLTSSAAPPTPPSQGNTVTDRDYLLAIIAERDRLYAARFDAQERANLQNIVSQHEAVEKAAAASEKRFDSVNEFRNQLRDQQNLFLQRAEYMAAHKALSDQIVLINGQMVPRSEHENRWKGEEEILRRVNDKLEILTARQFQYAGQTEGQNWLWGMLAGGLGLTIAMGTLVMHFANRPHRVASP